MKLGIVGVTALAIAIGLPACSSSDFSSEGEASNSDDATTAAPSPKQPAPPEFLPILGTFECTEGTITIRDDTFEFDDDREDGDMDVSGSWSASGSKIQVTLDDGTEIPVSYEIGEDPDGEWETFYGVFRVASEEPSTVTIEADDNGGSGGMMSVEVDFGGHGRTWGCSFGDSAADDIGDLNSDPSDGVCNEDRFLQDPDC